MVESGRGVGIDYRINDLIKSIEVGLRPVGLAARQVSLLLVAQQVKVDGSE